MIIHGYYYCAILVLQHVQRHLLCVFRDVPRRVFFNIALYMYRYQGYLLYHTNRYLVSFCKDFSVHVNIAPCLLKLSLTVTWFYNISDTPSPPLLKAVFPMSATSINISWQDPPQSETVASYQVQYKQK